MLSNQDYLPPLVHYVHCGDAGVAKYKAMLMQLPCKPNGTGLGKSGVMSNIQ